VISNNLSVICICSVLLTTIVLPYAAGGGGVPVLASEEFLTIESGFILPLDSNSIFMQHQIANNYGKPITVTVSSYQSAAVDLIDSVCDPMTIYPQQVMLIPYQPLNLDDLNRYTMLQASIDFKNPDDNNDEEIYIKKYELLLDDGANTNFSQTIDFTCEEISIIANPKYERVAELQELGMQSQSQQSQSQQSQSQQSQSQQSQSQQSQQQMQQQTQLLQDAQQLLQNYQQAAGYPDSALMPNQGPNLVEQNTAGLRDEIINEIMRNEEILQQLQQNTEFQMYDAELSNEGLIQQEAVFTTIEENEIEIDIPYENNDDRTSIVAYHVDGDITDVQIIRPNQDFAVDYLWIIPIILLAIAVGMVLIKKFTNNKTKVITPMVQEISVDNHTTINYLDITNQILADSKKLYEEKMYKDAHEKFGYAIRFYYSHHFELSKELTSIETLQILRKNNVKDFDLILDCLNLCGMIEFAKQEPDEKTFFDYIGKFGKLIRK